MSTDLFNDMSNYDLQSAIGLTEGLSTEPVEIALELTGQNDGAEWHWLVRLAGGNFAYIHGGCDYTGWDCQASAEAYEAATLPDALALVPQDVRETFNDMLLKGETVRENHTSW